MSNQGNIIRTTFTDYIEWSDLKVMLEKAEIWESEQAKG